MSLICLDFESASAALRKGDGKKRLGAGGRLPSQRSLVRFRERNVQFYELRLPKPCKRRCTTSSTAWLVRATLCKRREMFCLNDANSEAIMNANEPPLAPSNLL